MFRIRFWGVRGSIACPSPDHVKYGGNTSCIEIAVGDHRFVLDAGTGIRGVGKVFTELDVRHINLLLTHTHWDHINGFPFFTPAYDPKRSMRIMAGHLKDNGAGIHSVLSTQMSNPMFPVPLEAMQADMNFEDFVASDSFALYPDVHVRTAPLNHPNNATGYRIEYGGKSVCYITDTEHVPGEPDQNILGLIEGADAVIYDSTYTEDEFPNHIGWGIRRGTRACASVRWRTPSNWSSSTMNRTTTTRSWNGSKPRRLRPGKAPPLPARRCRSSWTDRTFSSPFGSSVFQRLKAGLSLCRGSSIGVPESNRPGTRGTSGGGCSDSIAPDEISSMVMVGPSADSSSIALG